MPFTVPLISIRRLTFFKCTQSFAGRLNIDAGMTRGRDNGECVHAVVFAHQFPRDVSDRFAVMAYVKRAVGIDFADLPAVFGADFPPASSSLCPKYLAGFAAGRCRR